MGRLSLSASSAFLAMTLLLAAAGCGEPSSPSPVTGAQLRLGSVLGETDVAGFARAEQPREFVFPADHGPHPEYRSEWWYLTLALADPEGQDVGVQFTLFRQALTPLGGATDGAASSEAANRWQSNQIYLAHFAVSDLATASHRSAERFARGHPALVGVQAEPLSLWLEDWRLEATGDVWRLRAGMADARVEIDLAMPVPIVLQGDAGLSWKGPDQASYYYSMPGIPASGQVWLNGEPRAVRGLGWLDREWSTSVLSGGQEGWDWLALQLDDGRRLMAFQLRRADGERDPYDQGMLVDAAGASRPLVAEDFRMLATRYWRDEEGTDWPVAWRLELDDEAFEVLAVLDDQRMQTSISYWEGLVAVLDADGQRIGQGYLELTGYAGPAQ